MEYIYIPSENSSINTAQIHGWACSISIQTIVLTPKVYIAEETVCILAYYRTTAGMLSLGLDNLWYT